MWNSTEVFLDTELQFTRITHKHTQRHRENIIGFTSYKMHSQNAFLLCINTFCSSLFNASTLQFRCKNRQFDFIIGTQRKSIVSFFFGYFLFTDRFNIIVLQFKMLSRGGFFSLLLSLYTLGFLGINYLLNEYFVFRLKVTGNILSYAVLFMTEHMFELHSRDTLLCW